MNDLIELFKTVRSRTEEICAPLLKEDYVVQPIEFVSPPKWHLGHTAWFFETFLLLGKDGYTAFDPQYNFVFNSYYESVGARVVRTDRGNLSRPAVADVYEYRQHVDEAILERMETIEQDERLHKIVILGLNHEQQHQELLFTDIKYILGHNPLFPPYDLGYREPQPFSPIHNAFITFSEGLHSIGHDGVGFAYDNEKGRHQVWLEAFEISTQLVSNADYLQFIADGGYQDFSFWHADGWQWVNENNVQAPLYWYQIDGEWMQYTLNGLRKLNLEDPVNHVSFYEASAYASWKKMRLPTEQEWEVAAASLDWGRRWEWTNSAYLPYPNFRKEEGAIGEYNGKFMVNQMVLRGASDVTSKEHSRSTYRNFFHASTRWQYAGIRLVKDS
ncbi:ergothioneine biosynthesis protein EgtB [Sphingobacterium paludis]|uniref:Ergothioneine biosynthesis protein EgtB n=1 Tax=Sphingobacterium paludis TaxID=1476465 RepID=A0A4R7CUY4_9SPHI|nr:ergothioneine biosynthesis protein EgtB [Sphingobacterium paludis]TDS12199.1 ergothioneine biosynthesis protein EgtB [Sphingobacterium paludis]